MRPAFLKLVATVPTETEFHASLTHSATSPNDACLMRPVFVKLWSLLVIQVSHKRRRIALKQQFTEMFSVCSIFVMPPGIMTGMQFFALMLVWTKSVMCALMLSITRRPSFVWKNPSGRRDFSSQSPIISIHPAFLVALDDDSRRKTVFRHSLSLKNNHGRQFGAISAEANTTVKSDFSWPIVLTLTVFSLFLATVLPIRISKVRGTSSMLTMWLGLTSWAWICSLTNAWKLAIFSLKSSGSFWQTVVRALMASWCHLMKRKHQDGPPTKSATFISFANVCAFSRSSVWPRGKKFISNTYLCHGIVIYLEGAAKFWIAFATILGKTFIYWKIDRRRLIFVGTQIMFLHIFPVFWRLFQTKMRRKAR